MKEDGFSLIELMIVVAILGIVAAIAMPNFIKARRAAHEANAVRFLKSWVPGQEMYKRVHGNYADTDEDLVKEKFINAGLNSNNDADDTAFIYSIDSSVSDAPRWWGTARRKSTIQAARNFYIDQTGVIRFNATSVATATDPPLN
jgi:prepilin-type N-terminal cleavage/methylation domain-containing protein